MKKGDIVQKEFISAQGNVLCRNFASIEEATAYGRSLSEAINVIPDDTNLGKYMVISKSTQHAKKEGVVHWVIGKEAAIVFDNSAFVVIDMDSEEAKDWKVIREAAPSFQSELADMSDEELRSSIEALRNSRMTITQRRTRQMAKDEVAQDAVLSALANLTPEQQAKLLEKLK